VGYTVYTGAGWVNNSGRASGNGPMDECSAASSSGGLLFRFEDDGQAHHALNTLLLDTNGVVMGSGFESEPARINARLASQKTRSCTMWGYA